MRKKKGSSMVFVIVTFAVTIIFGFSVLSLTLVSYKKRLVEVDEKRNQYFSEAGIDVAYGIIGKTLDTAVEKANQTVKSTLDECSQEEDTTYLKDDGTLDEDKINTEIFQPAYKECIKRYIAAFIEGGFPQELENKDSDIDSINLGNYQSEDNYNVAQDANNKAVVTVTNKDSLAFDDSNNLTLSLQSEFSSNKKSAGDSGEIHRQIAVNYLIGTPKYNEVYYVKTVKVPYNVVWEKAISIDGSLSVQGNFNVDGNVYVQGLDNNSNLHDDGINVLKGLSNINFNGVVATNGSVNISGTGNTLNVLGNIYSGTVFLQGDKNSVNVKPEGALNGALYTNNDLQIDGTASKVNIDGGFYGINDINEDTINGTDKPRVSSSILINTSTDDIKSSNGTQIKIGNKAIIMGVGYINTKNLQYQTGESVAIKGNYRAYTQPLNNDDEFNNDKVHFEYIDPLTLVFSSTGKKLQVQDKSRYFSSYNEEYGDLNLDGNHNIVFPDTIISVGAVVSDGKVIRDSYAQQEAFIRRKQIDFSKAVYEMANLTDSAEDDSLDNSNYVEEDYDKYGEYSDGRLIITTVSSQIDFNKVNYVNKKIGRDWIYLNADSGKEVYIKGTGGNVPAGKDCIDLSDADGGIIVTNGDVHLVGNIAGFKGTIISGKNVSADDTMEKHINYSVSYVSKLIGDNYEYFTGIFRNNYKDDYAYKISSDDSSVGTDVIRNKNLIAVQNWKIIK